MDPEPIPPCVEFDQERLESLLDVELPGRYDAISPVVERVLGTVVLMGCGAGKEFEIETALREALANAVRHGCAGDPDRKVQVCVACDKQRGMLIIVRDPGPGFDPAALGSPVEGEKVYWDHGRGIYLINQLMDEVSFHKGGTEIRMRKR
jgi:anti-sigma regulatory factor (Ser/Thr protein kinase)